MITLVDLSIKSVPEHIAESLRKRAENNNRSLQGELLTILEESVQTEQLTVEDAARKIEKFNLETGDEAAEMIRRERDAA